MSIENSNDKAWPLHGRLMGDQKLMGAIQSSSTRGLVTVKTASHANQLMQWLNRPDQPTDYRIRDTWLVSEEEN